MSTTQRTDRADPVPAAAANDVELLGNLQAGQRRAVDRVWDRHARPVFAFALARLPRPDAEEILQDVFVTLWRRRDQITLAGTSLLPWLLVTCRNLAANRQRRLTYERRHRHDGEIPEYADEATGPEGAVESRELRSVIAAAVDRLAALDQTVFAACIIDGLSYEDAARALGLTPTTIRNRLSRLRQKLRSELATLRGPR